MKDLIAKLQMDANCAMGAIWLHIDAREARIAELEAKIAAKADIDKLREALKLAVRQNSCDMLMTGEEIRKCEAALNSTAVQASVREVPEGMMLVPKTPTMEMRRAGNDALYKIHQDVTRTLADRAFYCYDAMISASPLPTMPVRDAWRPIETAPKDGTCILVCRAWDADGKPMGNSHRLFTHRAAWWADENGGNGEWIVYNSMVKDPECFFTPTHWMPVPEIEVPPLPAAPVQTEGE